MPEIVDVDLIDIFVGSQNIENIHLRDDEAEKSILQNVAKDIEDSFASILLSRPYVRPLLLLLWLRQFKFNMEPLIVEDTIEFIRKAALPLFRIAFDGEDVRNELSELMDADYLLNEKPEIALSSKGERTAEAIFRNEPQSITAPILEAISGLKKKVQAVIGEVPDFDNEGHFVSQLAFEGTTRYSRDTLEKYREEKQGVLWLNEDKTLGKTKKGGEDGHFFQKFDEHHLGTKYFLYFDEQKNKRFVKPGHTQVTKK